MVDSYKIPPFLNQILIISVIILATIGMKYISPILGPVLISIFISILIYPFLMWLKKRGFSYNVSILITLALTFVLGLGLLAIMVMSISQLVAAASTINIDPTSFLATYANQIIKSSYSPTYPRTTDCRDFIEMRILPDDSAVNVP